MILSNLNGILEDRFLFLFICENFRNVYCHLRQSFQTFYQRIGGVAELFSINIWIFFDNQLFRIFLIQIRNLKVRQLLILCLCILYRVFETPRRIWILFYFSLFIIKLSHMGELPTKVLTGWAVQRIYIPCASTTSFWETGNSLASMKMW